MITLPKLTLADVKRMALAGEAEAARRNVNVSIAICDEGGHPLWFQRMDRASLLSVTMAPSKARMAAMSGISTGVFQHLIDDKGFTSLLSAPGIDAMLQGGIAISVDGHVVGGIGTSGASSEDDEAISKIMAEAL